MFNFCLQFKTYFYRLYCETKRNYFVQFLKNIANLGEIESLWSVSLFFVIFISDTCFRLFQVFFFYDCKALLPSLVKLKQFSVRYIYPARKVVDEPTGKVKEKTGSHEVKTPFLITSSGLSSLATFPSLFKNPVRKYFQRVLVLPSLFLIFPLSSYFNTFTFPSR